MKRRVYFETIRNAHRPLVFWYLARGFEVRVFDFTQQLKFMGWLRRLLHRGQVERVYVHPGACSDALAMQAADWVYPKFTGHPLVRHMQRLFGAEEVEPLFKYALIQHASRYFFARLYLQKVSRENGPGVRAEFVPSAHLDWHQLLVPWCDGRLDPWDSAGIRVLRWPAALGRWFGGCVGFLRHRMRYTLYGLQLCLAALGQRLTPDRRESRGRFRLVYRISSPFQAKASGTRRFDFLLDGKTLTRENTAFVVTPPAEGNWAKAAQAGGHSVFFLSGYCMPWGLLHRPPRAVQIRDGLGAVGDGLRCGRTPEWIHETVEIGLGTWLREGGLLEEMGFQQYLYTNEYGLSPRWRNLFIRRLGGRSWNLAYSNGGCFLYRDDEPFAEGRDFGGPHRFWAYENADHMVFPSPGLMRYFQRHPQRIGSYHDVGNLWSEQQSFLGRTENRAQIRKGWFEEIGPGEKVIAWFDTTFMDAPNAPSTYAEAIRWYDDILRLADERPDWRMVVKPSKDAGFFVDEGAGQQWASPRTGRRVLERWERLESHPRIRLLSYTEDAQRVIFGSDAAVGFCFCAVTAEALPARKRAIWYEPGSRWRRTLWGKEPMLTAHGYAELKEQMARLLEMSDPDYSALLERTAKGLVDSFLDDQGLFRFRALLSGKAENQAGGAASRSKWVAAVPEGAGR